MSFVILLVPMAAVLAIILLSLNVRPRLVVVVWAALLLLATAAHFVVGDGGSAAPTSAEAPAGTESGA